jgi:glycosyltransferase involved in cell wall biosynthesis
MNGIPVIANNIGGTSEALERGGILVDVNRTEDQMVNEYRFQINKMLDDENYYRSIRDKALEQYHEYERNIHHLNQEHLMKYFS